MKIKFEELEYQNSAIDSIVNIFEGQESLESNFTVQIAGNTQLQLGHNSTELTDLGIANNIKIYEEEIVIIEGHVNQEGNKYHLVLNNINSVDELEENKGLKLYILIDDESQEQVSALKNLIMKNKGDNNVYFAMNTKGKQELVRLNKKYNVNLTKIFLRELIKIVGLKKIRLR